MSSSLLEIARLLSAELIGSDARIEGASTLEEAGPAEVSICMDLRHTEPLKRTRAGGVLVPKRLQRLGEQAPCPLLLVDNPRLALLCVLEHLYPEPPCIPGIQPGARLDAGARVADSARIEVGASVLTGAQIGERTWIHAGAFIGEGVRVGSDCRIGPNAVVREGCVLGDRVIVGACAVLGSPGFGFVPDGGRIRRIPQVGKVVIADDVEIGANTCVDRATLGTTRVGQGSKIDNLVQIGHNVQIGQRVILAAQVGLAGSVRIEDGAVLGGQVGVADHLTIGAGAQIGAKSGLIADVPPGARLIGYPAGSVTEWLETAAKRQKSLGGSSRETQEGEAP